MKFLLMFVNLIFVSYCLDGQSKCMIYFEKYEHLAVDTNNNFNLRVINNKGLPIFEWPEEIGTFEFVKNSKYVKLICYGNKFIIRDTIAEYISVPYCSVLIDTNICNVKTKVIIKSTLGSIHAINKSYDKILCKKKELALDEYSKYDELELVKFCYDITFSILNGCKRCIPIFYSLSSDFPILMYGLNSENYFSCRASIENIVTHKRIEVKHN